MALSRSVTISIPSLCNLDFYAIRFYDRAHRIYDAAILTRSYNQHALLSHIRHFIKILFVNKGIEFINFPWYI